MDSMPKGGKREGAGRKKDPDKTPTKVRTFRLTDAEYEKTKEFVKNLKKPSE